MEFPKQHPTPGLENTPAAADDPDPVDVLLERAEERLEHGELEEAKALCEQALQIRPQDPDAHALLADVLLDLGEIERAVATYRRSLQASPDIALAHARLGVALRVQGTYEEAIACFRRALDEEPDFPEALADLGLTLCQAGRAEEAVSALQQALELAPAMVDVRLLLADALEAMGRDEEALTAYRVVLADRPDDPAALIGARRLLLKSGSFEELILLCHQTLANHPEDPLALLQLGDALTKCRRYEEALLAFGRAVTLHPEDGAALHGLGMVLHSQGRHEEAIEVYGQALELMPKSQELNYDLGICLHLQGRMSESISALRRAIALSPNYANAHLYLACGLLIEGNFAEGWQEYQWRLHSDQNHSPALSTDRPTWEGGEVENGLLLWQEQGIGDNIMFLSLLQETRTFADSLIVQVDHRLLPLLERSFATDSPAEGGVTQPLGGRVVFTEKTIPVRKDCYSSHLPLGSLPLHLRRSAQDFTRQSKSYLRADPLKSRSLRDQLARDGHLICGISWRSINRTIGELKSIPLPILAGALARPELRLVSLQYGDVDAEIAALREETGIEVTQEPTVDNFLDIDGLASLIEACDLVISISSTTVHLAGALGKPTWVLLCDVPDWRWGLTGDTSLWYPSLRLFRQQSRGDWSPVLLQLRGALEEILGTSPRLLPLFDA